MNNTIKVGMRCGRGKGQHLQYFIALLSALLQNVILVDLFCFTMDNLNIHHNPEILELITRAGHCYIFRAPYWSCDGAIEYVFNTIHLYLLFFYPKLQSMNGLEAVLENIIENDLDLFSVYFRHVGFSN